MAFSKNQSLVAELYIASLGRSPDKGGLDYWVGELENGRKMLSEIQDAFFDTSIPEVAVRFPKGTSSKEYVENIYVNVFGRDSDKGGLAYWTSRLDLPQTDPDYLTTSTLMSTMLQIAKDPANYIDGAFLTNNLSDAETIYNNIGVNPEFSYILQNGYLTNTGTTDIILKDIGMNLDGILEMDGENFTFTLKGTIEQGFTLFSNLGNEYLESFDFPDQVISSNESFYLDDFLPASFDEDIPDVSGIINVEVSLITSMGVYVDESTLFI